MLTTGNSSEISLYFHIPFCTRKCDYCHFYVLPDKEASKDQLLEAFRLEWDHWRPFLKGKQLSTIYFGGGTPSLFGPSRLAKVLQWIQQDMTFSSLAPEITLEANPENIHLALMQDYARAGINRVSLGIQTLDNMLLQVLGRIHTAHTALQAVHMVHQAGIHNISIDLMYDLPKQSLTQWEKTLYTVRELPITHLSLYNLTIEPHTLFFKKQASLRPLLPDENTSLLMYEKAIELLEEKDLKQYEISAFSKPNCYSRHNVGYWTARSFLGFGPSAFSYWEGKRFRCIAHLNRYYEALKAGISAFDFEEQLDPEAHRRELFVIQLRLREGISLLAFEQKHGKLDPEFKQILQQLIKEKFLESNSDYIILTKQGVLFYDTVAAELI